MEYGGKQMLLSNLDITLLFAIFIIVILFYGIFEVINKLQFKINKAKDTKDFSKQAKNIIANNQNK